MTTQRTVCPDPSDVGSPSPGQRPTRPRGFTLAELLITTALLLTILGIAVAAYRDALGEAKNAVAIADISVLSKEIALYQIERGTLPETLADVGRGNLRDPWGAPYEYLNFASAGSGWRGQARKDRFLVPLNSDYDLYSKGPDGRSVPPLTANHSRDDIIRANDGAFIGLASEF